MSEMEEKKEKEKGKGKEKEEEVILDHFYHEHPLTLTESDSEYEQCYGCTRYIVSAETVYKCRDKCRFPILHEECAEMPREIRLSMHPQHTLIQTEDMEDAPLCAVCESDIMRIGYYCSSPDSCSFNIHVGCAPDMGVLKRCIDHPSHSHQLTLLWRLGRSSLSRCDACGTIERGDSYICIDCQYSIHESCKDLPLTTNYRHLHHHPLSLAFQLPLEYIKFHFACDICFKKFLPKYWVYHCAICRYVVHIKCAIKSSPANTKNIDANAAGNKNVITFPVNNAVGDLIGPFVTKVGGAMAIPHDNGKYKFHNHDHELSLISCPFHDEKEQKEEEEYSDDDDDDLNLTTKLKLICDGCTTPIYQRRYHSSSKSCNYYLSCGECKYFLHWECFHLPHELPSHPLHEGHNLFLKTPPKFDTTYCYICGAYTNGLIYECVECSFEVDMKCASLPDTIKHAAHPHHHLKLLSKEITYKSSYLYRLCGACGLNTHAKACYKCGICEFIVHSDCASLPAAVTNPAWDRHHPLPLTFDATLNRPGDFYCEVCEKEMNPRTWMYHCRSCDISFHPRCFPTASGRYRNIKFGQRFVVAAVHPHPVAYQHLTKKLRCDVCGRRKKYGCFGFQCAEDKCYFFMCLIPCARNYLDASLFGELSSVDEFLYELSYEL